MSQWCHRCNVAIWAYCLMPNHFHLLSQPQKAEDLSKWMQWLMTSHVRRYHGHYGTSGHVWQGRYKSFIVQENEHSLADVRYVEGNPHPNLHPTKNREWPKMANSLISLEAATRLELVNNGFADRCLSHLAMPPVYILERANGLEPSTSTLARWHSTAELRPLWFTPRNIANKIFLSTGKLPEGVRQQKKSALFPLLTVINSL